MSHITNNNQRHGIYVLFCIFSPRGIHMENSANSNRNVKVVAAKVEVFQVELARLASDYPRDISPSDWDTLTREEREYIILEKNAIEGFRMARVPPSVSFCAEIKSSTMGRRPQQTSASASRFADGVEL
jgi:hypothetical protein